MPGFFSHRRKLNPAPAGNWAAIPNSLYTKSFVEQKIHPDLNSLAEELSSSQGHELLDMTVDKGDPYAEATGFVGLEPSTRGSRRQNEAHTRTQEPQAVAKESEYQQIGTPVPDSANDIIAENFPIQKALKMVFVFQVQQVHPQAVPSVLKRQVRKIGGPFSEATVLEYFIVIPMQAMPQVTYRGREVNLAQVKLAAIVHPNALLGRRHELQSLNIQQDQPPLITLKEMTFCRHLTRSEYQRRQRSQ